MLTHTDIMQTIDMIDHQHLDIRTITMGISLRDCAHSDPKICAQKIYDKITKSAEKLVPTGEAIERELGIPIVNKRIAVTPMAIAAEACETEDFVPFAHALDRAAAACGGDVELRGVNPAHFSTVLYFLNQSGCDIISNKRSVRLISDGRLKAVEEISTAPYPGFPTDAQPVLMAALLKAEGRTLITENIFENRFRQAAELRRLGADITVSGRRAEIWGVDRLRGTMLNATDLRGGAAMIIAGLCAEGETVVRDDGHVTRGYERFDRKLRSLGADVNLEY